MAVDLKSIFLEQVRCFSSPRTVPIAPLTLLVGENSTGKSSFLALTRIACELIGGDLLPNFNREPFFLGAYDQVAHFRGGRGGRSRSFQIGAQARLRSRVRTSSEAQPATWRVEFFKRGSQPVPGIFAFEFGPYRLRIQLESDPLNIHMETPSWSGEIPEDLVPRFRRGDRYDLRFLRVPLPYLPDEDRAKARKHFPPYKEYRMFSQLFAEAGMRYAESVHAFAPMRTKPARTYDPVEDTPTPEGAHVPMLLAKTYFSDRERWLRLKSSLDRFGQASGLFDYLTIRSLGRSDSDPFQILIKIAGPPANLIDVGYGVSQALPILVDLIQSRRRQIYLLQQPEVHLHPRAQAELGSFLAKFAKENQSTVLVETHSDYLLDRVRMEIRDRVIRSDDVAILYFERSGFEVEIFPIGVGETGDIFGHPNSYRKFFMSEERKLLGL